MKFHKTIEDNWQMISDLGEIQAQIRDSFLQHEMNRTGASQIETLKDLFAHAIKLQDTLDALRVDDETAAGWYHW